MKRWFWIFVLTLRPLAAAEPLPPIVPIVTPAELKAAIADVTVSRIELLVPEGRDSAERVLSKRFFNRPEERRFSGLLTTDWEKKWQLFSDTLVARAKARGLDFGSLQTCLQRLNRGRNRQTMLAPYRDDPFPLPQGATRQEVLAFEKKEKEEAEKYRLALKDREQHPEKWYNESLAVVPVGAFLGQHSTGECWIVVCKWEDISNDNKPADLEHVMIWAMDTKSHEVVAYVTCD